MRQGLATVLSSYVCQHRQPKRDKPEHILVNRGAKDASWELGYPNGYTKDNVKMAHMWLAPHEEVAKPQVLQDRIAEGFVRSLPCEEKASASFRKSDDKWHCGRL